MASRYPLLGDWSFEGRLRPTITAQAPVEHFAGGTQLERHFGSARRRLRHQNFDLAAQTDALAWGGGKTPHLLARQAVQRLKLQYLERLPKFLWEQDDGKESGLWRACPFLSRQLRTVERAATLARPTSSR